MRGIPKSDLDTAIAFPILAFRNGAVDLSAHCRNVDYLIRNCFLDGARKRVIAIGGSGLLHHLTREEQLEVARVTGEKAGTDAWYISGILPTPPRQAAWLVRQQLRLTRAPDAFLLLPLVGGYNPEGACIELAHFCQTLGDETGAQFILYLRDTALREGFCRLVRECEHVTGIKIGTSVDDVKPVRDAVGEDVPVMWGIGDISTAAARRGARGHTSGSALLLIRASDEINNAQRRGDFSAAERIEDEIREFEELRFVKGRIYNYSLVVEALKIAGFPDVDPGDGGPFNAPPPPEICERLVPIVERLRIYHSAATTEDDETDCEQSRDSAEGRHFRETRKN
jgi:dihydrodipicolinate synthase/N-acetylneuraminate lyase